MIVLLAYRTVLGLTLLPRHTLHVVATSRRRVPAVHEPCAGVPPLQGRRQGAGVGRALGTLPAEAVKLLAHGALPAVRHLLAHARDVVAAREASWVGAVWLATTAVHAGRAVQPDVTLLVLPRRPFTPL